MVVRCFEILHLITKMTPHSCFNTVIILPGLKYDDLIPIFNWCRK